MSKPEFAPGCYGSAFSFQDDDVCGACPFYEGCKEKHTRAIAQLREFYGVEEKKPKRKADTLTVKTQQLHDETGLTKEQVRSAMQAGKNPYPLTKGYMGVVAHLVLAAKDISRPQLVSLLSKARHYNEETSKVYVRNAVQILEHCGAVTVNGKNIVLKQG